MAPCFWIWVEREETSFLPTACGHIHACDYKLLPLPLQEVAPSMPKCHVVEANRVLCSGMSKELNCIFHALVEAKVRAVIIRLRPHRGVAWQEEGVDIVAHKVPERWQIPA